MAHHNFILKTIELELTEQISGGEVGATGMGDNKSYTGSEGGYKDCVGKGDGTVAGAVKRVMACLPPK